MIAVPDTPKETPTASAGINAQSRLLQMSRPATSVVGLGARGALIDSALRFAGFTITRHEAGYRLICREGAK